MGYKTIKEAYLDLASKLPPAPTAKQIFLFAECEYQCTVHNTLDLYETCVDTTPAKVHAPSAKIMLSAVVSERVFKLQPEYDRPKGLALAELQKKLSEFPDVNSEYSENFKSYIRDFRNIWEAYRKNYLLAAGAKNIK